VPAVAISIVVFNTDRGPGLIEIPFGSCEGSTGSATEGNDHY